MGVKVGNIHRLRVYEDKVLQRIIGLNKHEITGERRKLQ